MLAYHKGQYSYICREITRKLGVTLPGSSLRHDSIERGKQVICL